MSEVRVARLAEMLVERGLDSLLIGDLVRPGDSSRDSGADLAWLCGFGGSSGIAIIHADPARRPDFVTDFRYAERAPTEVGEPFEIHIADTRLLPTVAGLIKGKIGFDDATTSVAVSKRLIEACGENAEFVSTPSLTVDLRRVKDAAEEEAIAAAASLVDSVYEWTVEQGLIGRSEREVALAIESRMRELGAEDPSFPSIVAAGPNSSLVHAEPGDRVIEADELVVIDIGAIVDGYCSDCTRTFATGEVDPEAKQIYEVVLEAQLAALEGVRAGAEGQHVDALAREIIAGAGYGEQFGHGTGHGVGVQVHEAPRLGKTSSDTLLAGDVVTVEPGIYFPGRFGVRIEDLVVVQHGGHRNLSTRPKQLTVVG